MCSASCSAEGTQLMPPSNQPTRRPGWRSRMPPRTYLPKRSRNGATDCSMPMMTALNSLGDEGGFSPMWCETGTCSSSIDLPHAVHGAAAEVDRLAVVVLARRQRHQEGLQPERLQLAQGPPGPLGIPPVDQADPVDAVARALLHLGDVLVVDAEAALAHLLVRPAEQGENGVREGQLLGARPRTPARPGGPRRRPCASRARGRTW